MTNFNGNAGTTGRSLNIVLVATGSYGDVHPFVGLGRRLLERGHRATVVSNPHFQAMIERGGLGFLPIGTADDYKRITSHPDLWKPRHSLRLIARALAHVAPLAYAHLAAEYAREPEDTVVVASTWSLAPRVAQEKLGVPLVTAHVSPQHIPSLHDTPRQPLLHVPNWLPRPAKRLLVNKLINPLFVDRLLGPPLNAWRAQLGLPPVRDVMLKWIHSPQFVIGLFPAWFAAPQPDWPPQVRLTGFPLFDDPGAAPMPERVARFLDDGDPPIAFTPGSVMGSAAAYLQAVVETCRLLGRRGVVLSSSADPAMSQLPPTVIHAGFVPLSELLPRAAALVHHGGIGTVALALAAGIPQLAMPTAHDQVENAGRMGRLGVGQVLSPKRFTGPRAARVLKELLESPQVRDHCRDYQQRLRAADPLAETCALIEGLARPVSAVA